MSKTCRKGNVSINKSRFHKKYVLFDVFDFYQDIRIELFYLQANIYFSFYEYLTTRANKKVQYGYPGKNGQVSDQTERT